jgi:hypothetical protein
MIGRDDPGRARAMGVAASGGDRVTPSAAPHTAGKTIRWARLYDLGTTLLSFGQLAALHRRIVEIAGIRPGERPP